MDATMLDFYDDDDAAANVVERRWFAASAQAKVMRDECDVLREVMDLAEEAWRRSRAQLAELEMLRDALGERLAAAQAGPERLPTNASGRGVLSAA
jgi:hypothetical protein